jgi:phospholipid transport system substrate-binding protein
MKSILFSFVMGAAFLSPVSGYSFDFDANSAAADVVSAAGSSMIMNANESGDAHLGQKAQEFVDDMAKNAVTFISSQSLTPEQKQEQFKALLEANYDMKTISRFAIGQYWRTASDAQKQEYQDLFKDMIVKVYSKRFSDYKGQAFNATGWQKDSDHDFLVNSEIVPADGSAKIDVDWRVRETNGQFKVIDVIVAGVSMGLTQRSEFSAIIQRSGGDIQALIDHLKIKG